MDTPPGTTEREADRVVRRWHDAQKNNARAERCLLTDAQVFLAGEHDFESWPKFAAHLESLTQNGSPVSTFEEAADPSSAATRAMGTVVACIRRERTSEALQECAMRKVGQMISRFWIAAALLMVLPTLAVADPVRLTVHFSVAGDARLDPDFGSATRSGSFSILTSLHAGQEGFDLLNGLGADAVSFTWAGKTWSADNADVLVLGFDAAGNVTRWSLNGMVPGDSGGTNFLVWPDFSVACGVCGTGRAGFSYTTPRSAELGIFSGRVTSFTMNLSATPTPVPEPMSLLLVGTGLAGLAARSRLRRKV